MFVYDALADERDVWFADVPDEAEITGVQLCGTFQLEDQNSVPTDGSSHGFDTYKNGDYASGANTVMAVYEWSFDMNYNNNTGKYEIQIPMISGAHYYYYRVYFDTVLYQTTNWLTGEPMDVNYVDVDDPANPSEHADNVENSNFECTDLTHSICYGLWDSVKQSETPNRDYMTPYGVTETGTVEYVTYAGTLSNDQDLGIYLPAGYSSDREEPYKVIYLSHGMGGNETFWFSTTQADTIMDHIVAENRNQEAIIVCLDNSFYDWEYEEIENNLRQYVIPYIEENYNVRSDKGGRAFCGYSMGAMTTTYMMFHCADLFEYFGVLSGCNIGNATFDPSFQYDPARLEMTESENGETVGQEYFL